MLSTRRFKAAITMTTTLTAQQSRTILANAHAAWIATADKKDTNPLRRALVAAGYIETTDLLEEVWMEGTTICIRVDADGFFETIELDAYGNTLRGKE